MTSFKTWTWKHPLSLFWMLMPALAINELLFGQRVPQKMLIEKDRKKPLAQRTFVPCPHCQTIHPSLKWSTQNKTGLGNWFGLYCDYCGGIIPCLWNLLSLLILVITFPVWIWFSRPMKQAWLRWQKKKFSHPLNLESPGYNWVLEGILWGCFMYVVMDIFYPLASGEALGWKRILIAFLFWMIGGLGYGYLMKFIVGNKIKKQVKTTASSQ